MATSDRTHPRQVEQVGDEPVEPLRLAAMTWPVRAVSSAGTMSSANASA